VVVVAEKSRIPGWLRSPRRLRRSHHWRRVEQKCSKQKSGGPHRRAHCHRIGHRRV